MNEIEKYEKVKAVVKEYYDNNFAAASDGYMPSKEGEDHIIEIGTSILCTKYDLGPRGGGFVESIVDNDLTAAITRADSTNLRALRFYVLLSYNVGYALFKEDLIA